jgi:hypothetical protein
MSWPPRHRRIQPVISSVSSLKERGRVNRGFTGRLSVFPALGGMLDWPAGLVWRPGAVVCPVLLLLPIRVSGSCRSRTGRSPAGGAGAARRP